MREIYIENTKEATRMVGWRKGRGERGDSPPPSSLGPETDYEIGTKCGNLIGC